MASSPAPPGEVRPSGYLSAFLDATPEAELPGIAELFEAIALAQPKCRAITGATWRPDYAALNGVANAIAAKILQNKGGTGGRVAILMTHDAPMIAAVLAVLKTQRVVVVVNSSDPPKAIQRTLEDAEPDVLITDERLMENAARTGHPVDSIVTVDSQDLTRFLPNPDLPSKSGELAFLVYTSGTQGLPKGVMQTHESVIHNAWRLAKGLGIRSDDRIVLLGSLSGGQGIGTTWTTLLAGATLMPFPIMDRGVIGLAEWLREEDATVYISSASVFRHFMQSLDERETLPSIRLVRLASEHATTEDHHLFQNHFSGHCRLATTFSSSETGNICQGYLIHDTVPPPGRLSVGRPAPGIEIVICDENGKAAGEGEEGEIVVKCQYLGPGYWRKPELTELKYSIDPTQPGLRSYRTGDVGRWTAEGELLLSQRKDNQAKVRGFRVELTAVDQAVCHIGGVSDSVTIAYETSRSGNRLCTFVVAAAGHRLERPYLRESLQHMLPAHMVPSGIVILEALPLTPHGKVDREALKQKAASTPFGGTGGAAKTATEKRLAGIWSSVLHIEEVGREDNFFDLGGDSLLAAVISAAAHQELRVTLSLRDFSDYPTLHSMAEQMDAQLTDIGEKHDNLPLQKPMPGACPVTSPLSFVEERTWRYSQSAAGQLGYTVVVTHRFLGPLDINLLTDCIHEVIERHEILRTTYHLGSEGLFRKVHSVDSYPIPLRVISKDEHAADELEKCRRDMVQAGFDLETGPLLRFQLLRLRENEHLLVRVNHHIISDGWSWKVFFDELAELYTSKKERRPATLPELDLQYGGYAIWQRDSLREEGILSQSQIEWWQRELDGTPKPVTFSFKRDQDLPACEAHEGVFSWGICPKTSLALDQLARETATTYFMIRLAGFAALTALDSGQSDFVVGSYVTTRQRAGLDKLFGFFSNLVTLRFRFDPEMTFKEWLAKVRKVVTDAQLHSDVPYERLCEDYWKAGKSPPEIRAIFSVAGKLPPMRFSDIEATYLERSWPNMPWGCSVSLNRWKESSDCTFAFNANLYDPDEARIFITQYQQLLKEASLQPGTPLINIFPAAGRISAK